MVSGEREPSAARHDDPVLRERVENLPHGTVGPTVACLKLFHGGKPVADSDEEAPGRAALKAALADAGATIVKASVREAE